ncbi:MAG: amidase [Pirellulaceae bacterium]|nr:MAG: amidase [Pirellulaceae bacterium]
MGNPVHPTDENASLSQSPKSGTDSIESVASGPHLHRRACLSALAAAGISHLGVARALAVQAEQRPVTEEMIRDAEWIAGIRLTDDERRAAAGALARLQAQWARLREKELPYTVAPALAFFPDGPISQAEATTSVRVLSEGLAARPESDEDLVFATVAELSRLLRERKVSSRELTGIYLERLKKFDPVLHCVVTLTEETAWRQAETADRELQAGQWRGPLHGVPWGAKDLISYPGYRTTWGATPYVEQQLEERATVAAKLDEAGAVLVAKLTLGALAQGDRWFGGMTRNPWNPEEGSSGSSAGSAAAVAAGLVGFAIGSETLGSIVSPCRRCGLTGLRPTFGRVSRYGCMPLAWSMDKLGPMARSAEDCALVLAAIHGRDARDPSSVSRPFVWPPDRRRWRVGYFEGPRSRATENFLEFLRGQPVDLKRISLPREVPADALVFLLNVEAATVFDPLTRQGITEGLNEWPRAFHQGQFTPAVEYLRANRWRSQLVQHMQQLFEEVDLYVGGNDLAITNLTGHPTVVFPAEFGRRGEQMQPLCTTITGRYFQEAELLYLVHLFQQQTDYHRRRPPLVASAQQDN